MLYQTFDRLVQEDVVKRATEILSEAVEKAGAGTGGYSRISQ